MGKKYKIIFERENCIAAAACVAIAEDFWTLDEATDGKADIKKEKNPTKTETGNQELIIDEVDFEKNLLAAQGCPVNVIKIIDLETGKEVPLD